MMGDKEFVFGTPKEAKKAFAETAYKYYKLIYQTIAKNLGSASGESILILPDPHYHPKIHVIDEARVLGNDKVAIKKANLYTISFDQIEKEEIKQMMFEPHKGIKAIEKSTIKSAKEYYPLLSKHPYFMSEMPNELDAYFDNKNDKLMKLIEEYNRKIKNLRELRDEKKIEDLVEYR